MIILDTHVLVWASANDRKLGRKARAAIERGWEREAIGVCAISFWEVAVLQARKRLRMSMPAREWRETLLAAGLVELALDGEIVVRASELVGLHDDPADRFIVSTALVRSSTLVTADERLLAWPHALDRLDASA